MSGAGGQLPEAATERPEGQGGAAMQGMADLQGQIEETRRLCGSLTEMLQKDPQAVHTAFHSTSGVNVGNSSRSTVGLMISGTKIDGILPGGPAQGSRVTKGDIIIAVDREAATSENVTTLLVGNDEPGVDVVVTIKNTLGAEMDVAFTRMATAKIADRRRVFDLFAAIKDRVLKKTEAGGWFGAGDLDSNKSTVALVDEAVEVWSKMLEADRLVQQNVLREVGRLHREGAQHAAGITEVVDNMAFAHQVAQREAVAAAFQDKARIAELEGEMAKLRANLAEAAQDASSTLPTAEHETRTPATGQEAPLTKLAAALEEEVAGLRKQLGDAETRGEEGRAKANAELGRLTTALGDATAAKDRALKPEADRGRLEVAKEKGLTTAEELRGVLEQTREEASKELARLGAELNKVAKEADRLGEELAEARGKASGGEKRLAELEEQLGKETEQRQAVEDGFRKLRAKMVMNEKLVKMGERAAMQEVGRRKQMARQAIARMLAGQAAGVFDSFVLAVAASRTDRVGQDERVRSASTEEEVAKLRGEAAAAVANLRTQVSDVERQLGAELEEDRGRMAAGGEEVAGLRTQLGEVAEQLGKETEQRQAVEDGFRKLRAKMVMNEKLVKMGERAAMQEVGRRKQMARQAIARMLAGQAAGVFDSFVLAVAASRADRVGQDERVRSASTEEEVAKLRGEAAAAVANLRTQVSDVERQLGADIEEERGRRTAGGEEVAGLRKQLGEVEEQLGKETEQRQAVEDGFRKLRAKMVMNEKLVKMGERAAMQEVGRRKQMARSSIARMLNGQAAGVFDSFVLAVAASRDERAQSASKEEVVAGLATQLGDAERQLEEASTELVRLGAELDKAAKEADRLGQELKDQRAAAAAAFAEVQRDLEGAHADGVDALAALRKQLSEVEKHVADVQGGAVNALPEVEGERGMMVGGDAEVANLRKQLGELEELLGKETALRQAVEEGFRKLRAKMVMNEKLVKMGERAAMQEVGRRKQMARQAIARMLAGQAAGVFDSFVLAVAASRADRLGQALEEERGKASGGEGRLAELEKQAEEASKEVAWLEGEVAASTARAEEGLERLSNALADATALLGKETAQRQAVEDGFRKLRAKMVMNEKLVKMGERAAMQEVGRRKQMSRSSIARMLAGQAAGVFDSFVLAVAASRADRATEQTCAEAGVELARLGAELNDAGEEADRLGQELAEARGKGSGGEKRLAELEEQLGKETEQRQAVEDGFRKLRAKMVMNEKLVKMGERAAMQEVGRRKQMARRGIARMLAGQAAGVFDSFVLAVAASRADRLGQALEEERKGSVGEKHLADLEKANAELERLRKVLGDGTAAKEKAAAELRGVVEQTRAPTGQIMLLNAPQVAQVTTLEAELEEERGRRAAGAEEVAGLRERLGDVERQREDAGTALARLGADLEGLRAEGVNALADVEEQLDAARTALAESVRQNAEIVARTNEAAEEADRARKALEEREGQLAGRLASKEEEVAGLRKQLGDAEEQLAHLARELAAARADGVNTLAELEGALREKFAHEEVAAGLAEAQTLELDGMRRELAASKTHLADAMGDLAENKRQKAAPGVVEHPSSPSARALELEEARAEGLATLADALEELDGVRRELAVSKARCDATEHAASGLAEERKVELKRWRAGAEEVERLRKMLADDTAAQAKSLKIVEKHRGVLTLARAELTSQSHLMTSQVDKLTSQEAELKKLAADLGEERARRAAGADEVAALRNEVTSANKALDGKVAELERARQAKRGCW
ncbi:hypothetical protein T484DRAFT_2022827 [Baffinella frigidus]|nr:hypothetical protein T484DRAFT_2022827 [Cryptophyta sp. CCMP2293]